MDTGPMDDTDVDHSEHFGTTGMTTRTAIASTLDGCEGTCGRGAQRTGLDSI